MLGCCRIVVAQWSEHQQLRSEASDSIPSDYPGIFSVIYPDLPPVASCYHHAVVVNQYSFKNNHGQCSLTTFTPWPGFITVKFQTNPG